MLDSFFIALRLLISQVLLEQELQMPSIWRN
jgi:hypothetical protein